MLICNTNPEVIGGYVIYYSIDFYESQNHLFNSNNNNINNNNNDSNNNTIDNGVGIYVSSNAINYKLIQQNGSYDYIMNMIPIIIIMII